ncbi:hypothetical protein BT63DRAFT_450110 [Microthyrium microscopicum]|uniref:PSP1 C-terminal domain-containing protein n=1 Tax=Microthyrium microscopicum TaxID=703497 RepID=A0A6A6UTJ1_9PEZI|nr:hypothetical protein BT63DRAFT_450110 [Microthyrium microscopicum]
MSTAATPTAYNGQGFHRMPQVLDNKKLGIARRSTPDSEALLSSDDDSHDPNPAMSMSLHSVKSMPQQRPVRRASWLSEVRTAQRKYSLGGLSLASTSGSQPPTPSAESGYVASGASGADNTGFPAQPVARASTIGSQGHLPTPSLSHWETAPAKPSAAWGHTAQLWPKREAPRWSSDFLSTSSSTSNSYLAVDDLTSPTSSTTQDIHSQFSASIPFDIPLEPSRKTVRSQSYSAGQSSFHQSPDSASPVYSRLSAKRPYPPSLLRRKSKATMDSEPEYDPLSSVQEVEETVRSGGAPGGGVFLGDYYQTQFQQQRARPAQQAPIDDDDDEDSDGEVIAARPQQQRRPGPSSQLSRAVEAAPFTPSFLPVSPAQTDSQAPSQDIYAVEEAHNDSHTVVVTESLREARAELADNRAAHPAGYGSGNSRNGHMARDQRDLPHFPPGQDSISFDAYLRSNLRDMGRGVPLIGPGTVNMLAHQQARPGNPTNQGQPSQVNQGPYGRPGTTPSGRLPPDGKYHLIANLRIERWHPMVNQFPLWKALPQVTTDDLYNSWDFAVHYVGGPTNPEFIDTNLPSMPLFRNQRSRQWHYLVTFKASRAEVYFIPEGFGPEPGVGDMVIVEGDRGEDLGMVAHAKIPSDQAQDLKEKYNKKHYDTLIRFARKFPNAIRDVTLDPKYETYSGYNLGDQSKNMKKGGISPRLIKRIATEREIVLLREKEGNEARAKRVGQQKVDENNIQMEILDAEFQLDYRKLTFYFYSTDYINFNEILPDLFKVWKTRIWLSPVNPNTLPTPTSVYENRVAEQEARTAPRHSHGGEFSQAYIAGLTAGMQMAPAAPAWMFQPGGSYAPFYGGGGGEYGGFGGGAPAQPGFEGWAPNQHGHMGPSASSFVPRSQLPVAAVTISRPHYEANTAAGTVGPAAAGNSGGPYAALPGLFSGLRFGGEEEPPTEGGPGGPQ